jgi:hypothetical protein
MLTNFRYAHDSNISAFADTTFADTKTSKQCDVCIVWPCKCQKWIQKIKLHLHAWVWRHPGHMSFLLANYCAMYASASKTRPLEIFKINISTRRIQTKFCTRKRLNTKSQYFTHIAVRQMTKRSRDIQDFPDMKFRIFGQTVSKCMIVSVCVIFWRHLTPRSKGYFVRISMVAFISRGVNTRRDIYIRKIG